MIKFRNTRGFTLIELLVVIAIIGILSSVVLASLSTARNKGNDSKVQGQLASFRNAAEIYYGNNSNYGSNSGAGNNICSVTNTDTTGLYNLEQASAYYNNGAPTCTTDAGAAAAATKYSAYHVLTGGGYWCVDSTGQSKAEASGWTAPTSGAPCP